MKTSDQRWMKNRLVVKLGLEPNPAPRSFLRVRSSILPQPAAELDPKMQRVLIAVKLPGLSYWSPVEFGKMWRLWAENAGVSPSRVEQKHEVDWCGTESRGWFRVVAILSRQEIIKMFQTQPEDTFIVPWSIFQIAEGAEAGKWQRISPGRNVQKDASILSWLKLKLSRKMRSTLN